MKLTIVGVAVLALLACLAAPAAAQKLSPAERVCAQTYLDKGVAASAPNPSVCTGGTITAYITDEGVPKVIEGKGTAFAEKIGLPGSCGIIVFYPGSFRPEDDSPDPPPPYAVTNFCSPNGLAHAYYNGLHEGLHTYCPMVRMRTTAKSSQ